MAQRIKVKKSDPPESTEILAEAVVRISDGLHKLHESGLNENAIVVLIQDKTKLPKQVIKNVLAAQRQLASWYCK